MTAFLLLLLFTNPVSIQDQYKSHIRLLADDLMEGRETGTRGQKLAAAYLASQFEVMGLTPVSSDPVHPYFQTFELKSSAIEAKGLVVRSAGEEIRVPREHFGLRGYGSGSPSISGEVVFVGYAVHSDAYDDYSGLDVKDRWLLVLDGEPTIANDHVPKNALGRMSRFRNVRKMGARGIITLSEQAVTSSPETSLSLPGSVEGDRAFMPFVQLSPDEHARVFGRFADRIAAARQTIAKEGKPASFLLDDFNLSFEAERKETTVTTENVAAILPGTDPVLKDEYLVLTAHYDHEGIKDGQVYNGADDNASGTTTMLLTADHLRGLDRKRSILFLLLTGEEKGLLGSEYFVAHPLVPLEKIVADINVDMIGRSGDGRFGLIPGEGSDVTTLNELARKVNDQGKFGMNFRTDMDQYHERSDHYNFTRSGVPALFFFTGVHEDYHQPTDDWDKLHYDEMAQFFNFFKALVLRVANDAAKPSFLEKRQGT